MLRPYLLILMFQHENRYFLVCLKINNCSRIKLEKCSFFTSYVFFSLRCCKRRLKTFLSPKDNQQLTSFFVYVFLVMPFLLADCMFDTVE